MEGRAGVEGAPRLGPRQRHPAPVARGGAPLRTVGETSSAQGWITSNSQHASVNLRVNLRELWLLTLLTYLNTTLTYLLKLRWVFPDQLIT